MLNIPSSERGFVVVPVIGNKISLPDRRISVVNELPLEDFLRQIGKSRTLHTINFLIGNNLNHLYDSANTSQLYTDGEITGLGIEHPSQYQPGNFGYLYSENSTYIGMFSQYPRVVKTLLKQTRMLNRKLGNTNIIRWQSYSIQTTQPQSEVEKVVAQASLSSNIQIEF